LAQTGIRCVWHGCWPLTVCLNVKNGNERKIGVHIVGIFGRSETLIWSDNLTLVCCLAACMYPYTPAAYVQESVLSSCMQPDGIDWGHLQRAARGISDSKIFVCVARRMLDRPFLSARLFAPSGGSSGPTHSRVCINLWSFQTTK
jgi:hypothetical protein